MLRKILVSLHKKPKHVRANFALGLAVFFTGLVSTVWFFGISNGSLFLASEVESEGKESGSPFSGLFKESKEYFANVKSSFQSNELNDNSEVKKETSIDERIDLNNQDTDKGTDTTFKDNGFPYYFSSESTTTATSSFASPTSPATSSEITNGGYRQNYQEVQIVTVPNESLGTTTSTSSTSSNFR